MCACGPRSFLMKVGLTHTTVGRRCMSNMLNINAKLHANVSTTGTNAGRQGFRSKRNWLLRQNSVSTKQNFMASSIQLEGKRQNQDTETNLADNSRCYRRKSAFSLADAVISKWLQIKFRPKKYRAVETLFGRTIDQTLYAQSYSSVQQGRRHVNKGGKRSVPSEYTPPMSIIKLKRVRYAQQKQLQRAEQRAKSAASLQKKRRDYRENMVVILKTILHSSNKDLLLLESVLWGHPGSPDASTLLDIPPTEV